MSAIDKVDVNALKSYYSNSVEIKAVFDWLANRERDPRNSETKAGNLRSDLASRGQDFTILQLRQALEKVAKTGCGTYTSGKPSENSRIKWSCSARELAFSVLAPNVVTALNNGVSIGGDVENETHYFPVRPGLSLPVTIRSDMTLVELENMADFLRIIAKSRGIRAN